MNPSLATVVQRLPDIRFRKVGDEWVVIRQRSAEVLVLNEWGGRVLELLDGSRTLGDVVDTLSNEFQTEPGVLQADVFRFAAEIQRAGLGESVREENQ